MKKRNLSGAMFLAIITVSLMMLFGCGSGSAGSGTAPINAGRIR